MDTNKTINNINVQTVCPYFPGHIVARNEFCDTCGNNAYNGAENGYSMCIKDTYVNDTIVVINEQHSLMTQQRELIVAELGLFDVMGVPATGWNKEQQLSVVRALKERAAKGNKVNVVFVSPLPLMIKALSFEEGYQSMPNEALPGYTPAKVYVMANNRMEKKELPNGNIVFTPSKEGWYLA